ncbi:efflux transporter outer membrane subunit [Xylophilus sp. GW821-FHT01B05]
MKPHIWPTAVALAVLAATGCTLEPHYDRPASPVASAYPTGEAYRAQTEAQASPQRVAADMGWRDFFDDPGLQRVVALALDNNRDLRVAVLNVAQTRAQYQIQRAGLVPSVNAVADASKSRTPQDLALMGHTKGSQYTVGAAASWELDLFGKTQSLTHQALAQYLATAEARRGAEISLVAQVASQYLAMRAYDEQLKVTRATLLAAQESARVVQLRYDAGTSTELDLREAQGTVEQQEANLTQQIRQRAQAENALVLLAGGPLPGDLPTPQAFDAQRFLMDIPAGLPSDLLARRPDVMEAEQQLRAANANIGAARAAFFPSISLTGQLGTSSPTLGGLFKGGSVAWSFAPQLTVPIFDGARNAAKLDLAQLEKQAFIAQYEKAIQTAFREVADGLAARDTYDSQIRSLQRYTALQQRRLDLSQLRYRNGVDSYLSVLNAQNALYSAQQSLLTTQLARLTNLVDLYRYLGGGWIERTGDAPRLATG